MHYVASNPPIILSASSYRGSNRCAIVFYYALNFSISLYNFLFTRMSIMQYSTGGRVFMISLAFCAFSCTLLTLSPISFNSGFTISYVQICMLSSHSLAHSSPRHLMLATEVMDVVSLCSFSLVGVNGVV
jgi:hypothetical protein